MNCLKIKLFFRFRKCSVDCDQCLFPKDEKPKKGWLAREFCSGPKKNRFLKKMKKGE